MSNTKSDQKYLEILRSLSPAKKLSAAFDLYDLARSRITSEIKKCNPNLSAESIKQLVIKRLAAK